MAQRSVETMVVVVTIASSRPAAAATTWMTHKMPTLTLKTTPTLAILKVLRIAD